MDHFEMVRMVAATFAEGRSRFHFGKEAEGKVEQIKGRIVEGIDTGANKSEEVDMG